MSESDVVHNAKCVQERIVSACQRANRDPSTVTLVAVSKTKPVSDIMALYEAGFRNFGENYFQELSEKVTQVPSDIKWHFIGHLQSQKASKLIKDVPNLHSVHTVDSEKLATKLNNALSTEAEASSDRKLNIMVQVSTSDEDTKSGVSAEEAVHLVQHIETQCPRLNFAGLMTIGAPGDLSCFDKLVSCRELVSRECAIEQDEISLSMGMSGDFEQAIEKGANIIRVGSTIFGERIYKK